MLVGEHRYLPPYCASAGSSTGYVREEQPPELTSRDQLEARNSLDNLSFTCWHGVRQLDELMTADPPHG
jgi:hypothetical protein